MKLDRTWHINKFLDRECNCNATTKVNVRCVYGGECRRCCVIYKVTCKCYGDFYLENTENTLKKQMEQHFQHVAQKVANDKNLETFAAHFAKNITKKPIPQQRCKIMSFYIIYSVKPIGSMKIWGKSCCTLCMKEKIEIIDNSLRGYSRVINTFSEVYGACRQISTFYRFTQH